MNDFFKENKTLNSSTIFFKRASLNSMIEDKSNESNDFAKSNITELFENENFKSKNTTPILNLNVHIGNGETKDLKIYNVNMIYKDAEDFCKMYNLPEEKLNLLINILKVEIQNTLTRIDEEDEEFDESGLDF